MPVQNIESIVRAITNKLLDLVIVEIQKTEIQHNIKAKIIDPLLVMIFKQLYPYIYGVLALVFLIFVSLVVLVVFFVMYMKK